MRFFSAGLLAIAALLPLGLAQTEDHHTDESGTGSLAPSPTESIGCEVHGDHWHCDGPRTAGDSVITSAPSASATGNSVSVSLTISTEDHTDHHHTDEEEHETHTDEEGTGTLGPSPTESIGCEAHGDHWHCDGPVEASTTLAVTVTDFPTGNLTTTSSSSSSFSSSSASETASSSTPTGGAAHATAAIMAPLAAIMGVALAL
ncbi:hypothetical protein ABW19_dt0206500 [Dactylella cylindrospora]|nr:hypothetical protein ABW19_dt0206500 [Dactylella cylindrospora]